VELASPKRSALYALIATFATVGGLAAGSFTLIGLFARFEALKDYTYVIKGFQYGIAVMLMAFALRGALNAFRNTLAVAKARKANEEVAEVLDKIKDQIPGRNVTEISTQAVAASLKGANVNDDQLTRLVEQRKQQLLIDDEYFREELSSLIVDYLQPLPRNAKRLLNRFRVSLLVAHSRGLLTSDPRVNAQQIGKWLVLLERWPQLGRSLSAAPEKMATLEEQSRNPGAPKSTASETDPFMESIKILAAPYFGDEDLRTFIKSAPALAIVMPRLVHYGAAEVPPPTQPS
jgi:hypothetical protein